MNLFSLRFRPWGRLPQMLHRPVVHPARACAILASGLILPASAHPLSFNSGIVYGSTQPAGAPANVANWSGAAFDADNIGGSGVNADGGSDNGAANDASTYVARNQPVQGQTFTTGGSTHGYDVTGITVRMAGYTNNNASGNNRTFWNLAASNGPVQATIGRIDGTTHRVISTQHFMAGGTGNPGSSGGTNGTGTYITFPLPYTVHLEPNTTYGFDLIIGNDSGNHFEWLGTRTDPYAGGTAYNRSGNTITPLAGDRVFMADMTASAAPHAPFTHPGALHTQADFDRMAAKVAANQQPWKASADTLAASPYAQTGWNPAPVQTIIRTGQTPWENNYSRTQEDAQAIYELALRWKVTGNTAYADRAVVIANAWAATLQGINGDSNAALGAGIPGYLFAVGGEVLTTYSGWPAAEKQAYKDMMMRVFYPANLNFLWWHYDTFWREGGNTHYRSNWDTAAIAAVTAIGILCDNRSVYRQGVDFFKNGPGTGRVERAAWYIFPDGMAQTDESGRDQPHNLGAWHCMALICQMAWNQGDDLFAYDNNRVLRAFEYNAKYNLGIEVPWVYSRNTNITYTETLSPAGRGLGQYFQYELVYGHYANVKGIDAPYSRLAMLATRPEPRPNRAAHPSQLDWLGLGSLTYARDTPAASSPPSGLRSTWSKNKLVLAWWGSATATGYEVKRATDAAGPYTTLGTVTAPELNFTDADVANGTTYFYKVTAVTPSGNLDSDPLRVARELVTRYQFENNTDDSVGNRHAAAFGGSSAPGYASGFGGGQALSLDGGGQHVRLPVGSGNHQDITLAAWVRWNGGSSWQRVFDFGSEIEKFMMLTVNAGSNLPRFQITTSRVTDGTLTLTSPTPMPTATWTHLAVSINGDTVTMYMNGKPVASGATTGRVSPMFGQPFCYLGRSMWNSDPYFSGRIDDFRIYNYGLTGNEVYSLWGQGGSNSPPVFTTDPILPAAATEDADYSAQGVTLATHATDPNGGALTYSKVSGPTWLAVAPNGALSGTPTNEDVGANLFVVRVTDPAGATDDANLHIAVGNTNDAPAWSANPVDGGAVTRGESYSFALAGYASDADTGDTFTISRTGGPAWLGVAPDGTASGSPGAGDVGVNTFTVRATDPLGAFSETQFAVTVRPHELRAHLKFEGDLTDTSGNYPGTGSGSPGYTAGRAGQAILFDAIDDFVTLPAGVADSEDITIAAWVNWAGGGAHQRIFDFGTGTGRYLFLTPSNGSNLRFAIKNNGAEQQLISSPMVTNQWVHVAVTLSGNTGRMYVNGNLVATNTGMTINPADFRPTTNLLGDSQWPADPFFNGLIDEFRVYNHALSAGEIAALLDDIAPSPPSNLTATPRTGRIDLTWSAVPGALGYTVKRGFSTGGPYSVLASGLGSPAHSDTDVTNGTTYHYVVTATNANGTSADSEEVAAVPSDLLVHLKFDENTGTTAHDSGGNPWDATLVNTPAWTPGILKHAVDFPATAAQHATLPSGVVAGLTDFTICTWIRVNSFATWQRIFDFGTGTNNYMFLTTQYTGTAPNNAKLRFGIRTTSAAEQSVSGTAIALPTGTWTHVAVTRSGNTVRLHVNGAQAGTGSITLDPSALGTTTLNHLGKSQWNDPYLNGALDDFRIYGRALTTGELTDLANPPAETPEGLDALPGDGTATLAWNLANAAASYSVKRSTTSGGPYTTVASGITDLAFTDTGLTNETTYHYVVSAGNTLGESADSPEVAVTPTSQRIHLRLDETAGSLAADSSGRRNDAATVNSPVWESGKLGNGLRLAAASSQHVDLPVESVAGLTDFTVMTWVKLDSVANFVRIFDFGNTTAPTATAGAYMFLTPTTGSVVRFAITTAGYNNEQRISGTAPLATGSWQHVAVTLSGGVGRLYVNGNEVGSNPSMTLTPESLGSLANLYIGRSQFAADPYLNGSVDEFRIYGRALPQSEVRLHASPLAAPQNPLATPGPARADLAWDTTPDAFGYRVKRSLASGGPYTTIAPEVAVNTYQDVGLQPDTAYFYIITATNSAGESPDSAEVSAVTLPPPPPAAPSGLVATAVSTDRIDLTWNASSGATAYHLKRSVNIGGPFTTIASALTGTSHADTGLSHGTYYYVVSAVNAWGEGADSGESSATTETEPITDTELRNTVLTFVNEGAGSGEIRMTHAGSVAGHTYQIEGSPDLLPGSWQSVGDPRTGDGGPLDHTIPRPAVGPPAFYRVRITR